MSGYHLILGDDKAEAPGAVTDLVVNGTALGIDPLLATDAGSPEPRTGLADSWGPRNT
ncbi:hypothetical protein ACFO4E_26565 [Nocardiopsis mangrovi]|uniref:Uncharacterized protein n=1 Tax=Nocardiopsis mangrovi TaxID=1179818 RepID=A0ABV9E2V3_9ACTN